MATAENYKIETMPLEQERLHHGTFSKVRETLDYSYHNIYTKRRQEVQDLLVSNVVAHNAAPVDVPWIVFTAGAMGAGKSYTIRWMSQEGYFPLEQLFVLDPDEFKKALPEWNGYVRSNPLTAGDLTHRESGLLTEIAQNVLLERRLNIQVDGSLRDWQWYRDVFLDIKTKYPHYRIAIVHIYADAEVVYRRVAKRAAVTGRLVPKAKVDLSLKQVPESVDKLCNYCDFIAHVDNSKQPILTHLFDSEHPEGYNNPNWSQIRSLFPFTSDCLKNKAKEKVEELLKSKEPILFSKTYCTFCDRTKDLLRNLHVQYQVCEINIMEPYGIASTMQGVLKGLSGTHTVPQLFYNHRFIGSLDKLKQLYMSGEVLTILPARVKEPLPALESFM